MGSNSDRIAGDEEDNLGRSGGLGGCSRGSSAGVNQEKREERAAVYEFDAGISREEAERRAFGCARTHPGSRRVRVNLGLKIRDHWHEDRFHAPCLGLRE